MLRLRFKELNVGGDDCHVARTFLRGPVETTLHTHDFPEIFYVTGGAGTHRVNHAPQPLAPGDCCFIRPADAHGYAASAGGSVEFINVAFSAAWWRRFLAVLPTRAALRERLAREQPPHVNIPEAQRDAFRARFETLLGGGEPVLRQVEVCTAVMRLLLQEPPVHRGERPPAWLQAVVAKLREREFLNLGLAGIYRVAGRSPEHVARTCKKFLAVTPTELLNRARIERAQVQLLAGDEKISTLALENGFENLGYFYRVFRRLAGCSPQQWRRGHSAVGVVPP